MRTRQSFVRGVRNTLRNPYLISICVALALGYLAYRPLLHAYSTVRIKSLTNDLLAQNLLDHSADELLQHAIPRLLSATGSKTPVSVNARWAADALNIYVIARAPVETIGSARAVSLMRSIPNNAIAKPPNTIVIDSVLLKQLLLTAYNEVMAKTEPLVVLDGRKDQDKAAYGLAVRDDALINWYRLSYLEDGRAFTENFRHLLNVADELIAATAKADKMISQPVYETQYAFALAPVIFHELGHLEDEQDRPFSSGARQLADTLSDAPRAAIRRAEEAADAYAMAAIQKLIAATPEKSKASDLEAASGTVKYLRDIVLDEAFEGFRGLSARHWLVTLHHKQCPASGRPGEWREFAHTGSIEHAYLNPLPVMTADEFELLRFRMGNGTKLSSHPHDLARSAAFGAAYQSDLIPEWLLDWKAIIGDSRAVLQAVEANDPKLLSRDVGTHMRRIEEPAGGIASGISYESLFMKVQDQMSFEPGVNCIRVTCLVGKFKGERRGSIEVIGSLENLKEARVVLPIFGNDPVGKAKGSDPTGYFFNMAYVFRLVANALGIETNANEKRIHPALESVSNFRADLLKCGSATLVLAAGTRIVELSTITAGDWVSIRVTPSTVRVQDDTIIDVTNGRRYSR